VLNAPTPGTIRANAPGGECSLTRSAVNAFPANFTLALLGNVTQPPQQPERQRSWHAGSLRPIQIVPPLRRAVARLRFGMVTKAACYALRVTGPAGYDIAQHR
jgi:hypothetical protein